MPMALLHLRRKNQGRTFHYEVPSTSDAKGVPGTHSITAPAPPHPWEDLFKKKVLNLPYPQKTTVCALKVLFSKE